MNLELFFRLAFGVASLAFAGGMSFYRRRAGRPLIEQFDDDYRRYRRQTGGDLPRLSAAAK